MEHLHLFQVKETIHVNLWQEAIHSSSYTGSCFPLSGLDGLYSSASAPVICWTEVGRKGLSFILIFLNNLSWFYFCLCDFSTCWLYFLLPLKFTHPKVSNPSTPSQRHISVFCFSCSCHAADSTIEWLKSNLCCEFWLYLKLFMLLPRLLDFISQILILSLRHHSLSQYFLFIFSRLPNLELDRTSPVSFQFIQCYC